MSFTFKEQRNFIETHFLKNDIINHISDKPLTEADPFIPSQPPTIYDIDHISNLQTASKSYKYLDDLMLTNNLVLFPRNLSVDYKIHLCVFSVNTDLDAPFLQFMFSKNNSQYRFPNFDLDMKKIQDSSVYNNDFPEVSQSNEYVSDDEHDSELPINNEFLNQCVNSFHDNIIKKTDNDMNIESRYRGFIEDEDNTNNELYVFFDCTGLHIELYNDKFKNTDYIFAIVDEINKGKINDTPISNDTITMFKQNPFITEINTRNGEPIISPIIAYICTENEDNNYTNVYNNDDTLKISLIPPQITHPEYGNIYVFSSMVLTGDYNNIKRFALFYEEQNDENENMDISSEENDDKTENMEVSSEENDDKTKNMEVASEENDDKTENMEVSSEENEENDDKTENMEVANEENDDKTENMEVSSEENEENDDKTENMEVASEENEENDDKTENMEVASEESEESDDKTENMEVASEENEENDDKTENMEVASEESEENDDETENMEVASEESEENDDETENMEVASEENDDENENMELELDENVVFTFQNTNEQSFYGTYSIETFIEI